jgi:2,4-dienoyl-CoA reductase (NADPH2)
LFEASDQIGGQFNMAKRVPGKHEFHETLRWFRTRLAKADVDVRLNTRADIEALRSFDCVIVATGVHPRKVTLPGIDHPMVLSYADVLLRSAPVGARVALIGAGGIGFDVAEFLSTDSPDAPPEIDPFLRAWGVDKTMSRRGGLTDPEPHESVREITICQRSKGKLGAKLGKTTGWIHRTEIKKKGIVGLSDVTYDKIDDRGLHITIRGESIVLEVDNVVVCAGQVSSRDLEQPLEDAGVEVHLIGGAQLAAELDAKRAIDQGLRLAAKL